MEHNTKMLNGTLAETGDTTPFLMNVMQMATFMNISRKLAYELVNSEDFPTLRIKRKILIPKEQLLKWIERNTNMR